MSVLTPQKLKPATKQEFISALRSGEYEQCTNGNMKLDIGVGMQHMGLE